ncbi:MAG: glycoside hydrolase family 99-like domain-containing protein [Armatimonadota bacterium]
MQWSRILCSALAACFIVAASAQQTKTLIEWTFDRAGDREGWQQSGHMADVRVAEGALMGRATDWDPIVVGPQFEIQATPWQWIETRIRSTETGTAEFFWSNTMQGEYGPFTPGKETRFGLQGDGQYHVYRIYPYWQAERKIIILRLDFPAGEGEYAVDYIRVVEPADLPEPVPADFDFSRGPSGWSARGSVQVEPGQDGLTVRAKSDSDLLVSPPLDADAQASRFAVVRISVGRALEHGGNAAELLFASSGANGQHAARFYPRADGQFHTYNLPMSQFPEWRGRIVQLAFRPPLGADSVRLASLKMAPEPGGRPDVVITWLGCRDAIPRAGADTAVEARIENLGATPTGPVQVKFGLPRGLTPLGPTTQTIDSLVYRDPVTVACPVRSPRAIGRSVSVQVSGDGFPTVSEQTSIAFTPRIRLPQTNYVPEPQPVETDYQVGIYYFPGWWNYGRWLPIMDFPARRPVLGWYQEGLPEVADWHIKWALEHGISFFIYDWYWDRGARQLEHALHDGFFQARYRDRFKFCLLWANHNPKGSSSLEDCEAVTRFWVDNYFQRPEHLTIEGKPVVVIFSTRRLTDDLGHENVSTAFDRMRQICRDAGLPGLYIVACTYSHDQPGLQALVDEGYDAVSGYNYPGLGAGASKFAHVDSMLEGYLTHWTSTLDVDLIKEIPVLSGGWDSRPWHHEKALVRYGLDPTNFEAHCRDAKRLLDEREQEPKLKMCFLEAWNEFGEGSYVEPHRQFGFGYLDALRRVFTNAPDRHQDVIPADVGLGPYDCEKPKALSEWTFDDGQQGWTGAMGMRDLRAEAGSLAATTVSSDPAFFGPGTRVRAADHPFVAIRMKLTMPALRSADARSRDTAQLFWSTTAGGISEAQSMRFEVTGDGQWHDYRVPVHENPTWRGVVTNLRFDPCNQPDVEVWVDYIKFARQ